MSVALVVLVSWMYTYSQTHRVVDIKYVEIFTCQSYLHKKAEKESKQASLLPTKVKKMLTLLGELISFHCVWVLKQQMFDLKPFLGQEWYQ